MPPKLTDPEPPEGTDWVPAMAPPGKAALAAEQQYRTQLAEDLAAQVRDQAEDLGMVFPTAGMILAEGSTRTARGLINIGARVPWLIKAAGGTRFLRDGGAIAATAVRVVIGALVDMGRVDPEGRVAQRTGVAAYHAAALDQLERRRAQIAGGGPQPATLAFGGPPQQAGYHPVLIHPDAYAAMQYQQMQAQAALAAQYGPSRTPGPGWRIPGQG